ncbi:MAG: hypothetical protein ACR2GD_14025 [Pyrinomonadaceae bacterium]
MNKARNGFALVLTIGLMIFGSLSQAAAQYRGNQRQVNDILRNLNVKIDTFRNDLDNEFQRSTSGGDNQNQINNYLDTLQNNLSDFQGKIDRRRETTDDVSQILQTAKSIDDFVAQSGFSAKLRREWTESRPLFDQLASSYGISPYWNTRGGSGSQSSNYPNGANYPNDTNYPNGNSNPRGRRNNNPNYPNGNSYNYGLTGTYQLDVSRSENTRDIAEKAINGVDAQRQEESRQDLEEKLRAPEQLAIDVRGNQVTLASSLASQVTFTADGSVRNETLPDGRDLRLRTTLRGQELTVSSVGGDNDYTVVFSSIDNGKSLKVTRRITTDYLNQTVFAESVYNKTDQTARLDIFDNQNGNDSSAGNSTAGNPNGNNPNGNYPAGNYPNGNAPVTRNGNGQFVVPNGTILTGRLENDISTEYSQNNDRFRLTVTAPNQYQGAVIEGYLSGISRSGKVSGRSQLTFNFETIHLTNGNTYDFAGFLQSVTDINGKTVNVDTEGTAKGDNQTKTTATRGAIGAGLGALIGAIAGGGKGAAIGAILGGGAGAGSVYVQGKDDLELKSGSSVTVQSSSPNRQ